MNSSVFKYLFLGTLFLIINISIQTILSLLIGISNQESQIFSHESTFDGFNNSLFESQAESFQFGVTI